MRPNQCIYFFEKKQSIFFKFFKITILKFNGLKQTPKRQKMLVQAFAGLYSVLEVVKSTSNKGIYSFKSPHPIAKRDKNWSLSGVIGR
jgi:hypothetical protein